MKLKILIYNLLASSLLLGASVAEKKSLKVLIKMRINEQESIDEGDENDVTLLQLATLIGNEKLVRKFVSKGASIKHVNDFGTTVLHIAATEGYSRILSWFFSYPDFKEILNQQTRYCKETALHRAAIANDIDCTRELLTHDCAVNVQDAEGQTPLHWALERGSLDLVKLLIAHGADISITDNQKRNAFHKAADLNVGFAEFLLLKCRDQKNVSNLISFKREIEFRKRSLLALDSSLRTPAERAHFMHQHQTAQILQRAVNQLDCYLEERNSN